MRILQLIDSLEAGGAERMAVNFANALVKRADFSALVATRQQGPLRGQIDQNVNYLFLDRKRTFDFNALSKLRDFARLHQIQFVHAHSTSIYMAVMLKLIYPRIRVIWHDHYGNSEYLSERPSFLLKSLLRFCTGAIAVNTKLENWIRKDLSFQNTMYLPNFAAPDYSKAETILKGPDSSRIICVANLREQKNHVLLLNVAVRLKISYPNWTFHLVGKDFHDGYSSMLREKIKDLGLGELVFLYGSCNDTGALIARCDIAVLSSKSEGLPVALLEYGMLSKPVLSTSVGEIPSIIQDGKNGYLAMSENEEEFYDKLVGLIEDDNRAQLGKELQRTVSSTYSSESIINTYLEWLKKL